MPPPLTRKVIVAASHSDRRYCQNKVHTCKYAWYNFLPYFLYDQFSKPANVFFLCISSLQQIEGLSPTGRWGTLVPLLIVLSVSAAKEIFEDIKRRNSDKEVNCSKVFIVESDGRLKVEQWQNLSVGQVVKVSKNEALPADLVLLATSEPGGFCYIETANIDGESNLKLRQARPETASVASLTGAVLTCAPPNEKIFTFEGSLQCDSFLQIPLGHDQFLPRGSVLKNSEWVIGLVVYTGHETKIFMNAQETPRKSTRMEKMSDFQIVYIVILLLVMILVCFCFNYFFETKVSPTHPYLRSHLPENRFLYLWNFFANVVTFLLLFNNLVPISLAITIEALRFQLAELINSDRELYDPETDRSASAKSSNLLEELGQVEYILTDKTGTLTRNEMVLKHVIIGDAEFRDCTAPGSSFRNAIIQTPNTIMTRLFLENLLTCHSVMIDRSEQAKSHQIIRYQAASPDELGIIEALAKLGIVFTGRSASSLIADWSGLANKEEEEEFRILAVIEFTSERKMMSVLVRRANGTAVLFSKGADSAFASKMQKPSSSDHQPFTSAMRLIKQFAVEGLRTLCLAYRELSEQEVSDWMGKWTGALNTVVDRQGAIDSVASEIENGLQFLGAVAIEDRLQDRVPEAISTLIKANIRIWMLTGDRAETAINTGYLSGLLTTETVLLNLLIDNEAHYLMGSDAHSMNSNDHCSLDSDDYRSLDAHCSMDNDCLFLKRAMDEYRQCRLARHAIVVNGLALERILSSTNPEVMQLFAELCSKCSTVVACRLSPIQKAQIAEMIKIRFRKVVLAVGDGGNDVGMIQAANVGVGITGLEGLQAARSSDFTIAKFPMLARLLLVHGSWSLHRVSRVIQYANYKNLALFMCQFWYAFQNMFSGQSAVPSKWLVLYNLVFTAAPPIVLGLTEQYVPAERLLRHPQLYTFGQRGKFYDDRAFLTCVAGAVFTSFLVFFLWSWVLSEGNVLKDGRILDNYYQGTLLYLAMLVAVSLKLLLFTNFITTILLATVAGSILAWFLVFLLTTPASFVVVLKCPSIWAALIAISLAANARDFLWKFYRRVFRPRPYHIVQEMVAVDRHREGRLQRRWETSPSRIPLKDDDFFSQSGEGSMLAAYGVITNLKHQ